MHGRGLFPGYALPEMQGVRNSPMLISGEKNWCHLLEFEERSFEPRTAWVTFVVLERTPYSGGDLLVGFHLLFLGPLPLALYPLFEFFVEHVLLYLLHPSRQLHVVLFFLGLGHRIVWDAIQQPVEEFVPSGPCKEDDRISDPRNKVDAKADL